jgi:hypothetical protein
VAWLGKLGLSHGQVFGLMGIYSAAGKRLGVAAEALRRHLDGKSARDAFAYLRSMASRDLDFGRVIEMRRQDDAALQAEQASRLMLERLRHAQRVRHVASDEVYVVELAGASMRSLSSGASLPVNGRLADRVIDGIWEIVE